MKINKIFISLKMLVFFNTKTLLKAKNSTLCWLKQNFLKIPLFEYSKIVVYMYAIGSQ